MRMLRAILFILISAGVSLGQDPAVTRALHAMVTIRGTSENGRAVSGNGFIVTANGSIVTNLHLVKGLTNAKIELANDDIFDSFTIVATDARRDLAIIRIAGFDLPFMPLGNSSQLQQGDAVTLVRGPKSETSTSTIRGLVAGDGFRLIQISGDAQTTVSGGALLNADGNAVGVLGYTSSTGSAVAIPINYARGLLDAGGEGTAVAKAEVNERPVTAAKPEPAAPAVRATAEPTPSAASSPQITSAPAPIMPSAPAPSRVESTPPASPVAPKPEPAVIPAAEKAAEPAPLPARSSAVRATPVRKIYIEPIGTGEGPELLRDGLVRYLEQSHFEVVNTRQDADAVLSGTGSWSHVRLKQFRARLVAADDQELWSGELSTGGWIRSASGTIARDLVKNIVRAVGQPSVRP